MARPLGQALPSPRPFSSVGCLRGLGAEAAPSSAKRGLCLSPEGGQEGLALDQHWGLGQDFVCPGPGPAGVTERGTHPLALADGRPLCSRMSPLVP